jgi:hypothetical protein
MNLAAGRAERSEDYGGAVTLPEPQCFPKPVALQFTEESGIRGYTVVCAWRWAINHTQHKQKRDEKNRRQSNIAIV